MKYTEKEKKRFEKALESSLSVVRDNKIGLLKEKLMHTVIKNYIESDIKYQEIKVGSFYADIKNKKGIFEVQTSSLFRLREKLAFYLRDNKVTVIHPVIREKYLIWISPESGEMTKARKSPKRNGFSSALYELSGIAEFLDNPNLTVRLLLIDADEYRLLDGYDKSKKHGSHRENTVPHSLVDICEISLLSDLKKLLPENMPSEFTVKEFSKAVSLHGMKLRLTLYRLNGCGFLTQTGKKGNAYIYKVNI